MTDITMGSLFDGSAGFPLAGVMYGMTAVWASEVEPYPIRVTTKRLPFMKHYGDISKMNGAEIEPVDVITGGSPCQDMSVAGKRAGLDGERSCLFREQIRIIKEMREATNGRYPRYMVWENVPGALSSNKGADFKCVLEETARIKDAGFNVPMPEKGKWGSAGLIMGEGFSVGWRILDAQYWGVPQRRRRIFLVADFSGTSSREILFKREGLSWHFAQSRESWQTVTGNLTTGTAETGEDPVFSIDREAMNSDYEFDRAPGVDESETAYTLKATGPGGVTHPSIMIENHPNDSRIKIDESGTCQSLTGRMGTGGGKVPLTMQVRCGCEGGGKGALIQTNQSETLSTHNMQTLFQPVQKEDVLFVSRTHGVNVSENVAQTIQAAAGTSGNNQPMICQPVQVMNERQYACTVSEEVANTLTGTDYKETQCAFVPEKKVYGIGSYASNVMKSDNPHSGIYKADTSRTLDLNGGNPACNQGGIAVCEPKAYSIQGNMIGRADKNGPQGNGINEDVNFTLNATDQHAVCTEVFHCNSEDDMSPPLKARDYKDPHVVAFDRASFNQGQNARFEPQFFEDGTMPTLIARGPGGVCHDNNTYQDKAGSLCASGYNKLGTQEAMNDMFVANNYIVRRLTPLECARLQGFPDWWTANLGTKEEDITEEDMNFWRDVFETHREVVTKTSKPKTDKQIRKWLVDPDNDSAEYKMWGNGVALPCVLYVMEGIANVLNKERCNGQPIVCEFQNGTCCYPIDDCENCPVRKEI